MKTIIVSPAAQINLARIADFLEIKWSLKVRNEFVNSIDAALMRIAKAPESFPFIEELGLRKYLLHRRTVLLYRITKDAIEVVQAFDARQNYQDKDQWK